MLPNLYVQLLLMSLVASALYFLLRLLGKLTQKYFSASWHYYSYVVAFTFFLIPYHKLIPVLDLNVAKKGENPTELPSIIAFNPSVVTDGASLQPAVLQEGHETGQVFSFIFDALPYVLMAGTLIFIGTILIQNYRVKRRIFRMCEPTTDPYILRELAACRKKLGVKKEIPVYLSPYLSTPFLYGIVKPRIILPSLEFTSEEYYHVFLHELTHYKRRDNALKGILILINALHWFNPFVYMARREIDRFSELSCDEKIVQSMNRNERKRYCELLLSVLWAVADQRTSLYSAFSDKRKYLERRIGMILNNDGSKRKKTIRLLAVSLTLSMAIMGAAGAYVGSQNAPELANNAQDQQNQALEAVGGSHSSGEVAAFYSDSYFNFLPVPNGLGREGAEVEWSKVAAANVLIRDYFNGADVIPSERDAVEVTLDENAEKRSFVRKMGEEDENLTKELGPSGIDLNAKTAYTSTGVSIDEGESITIRAFWTPGSDLELGVYSHSTHTFYYSTVSNSSDLAAFRILKAGEYSIYVRNPSESDLKFDVSYVVHTPSAENQAGPQEREQHTDPGSSSGVQYIDANHRGKLGFEQSFNIAPENGAILNVSVINNNSSGKVKFEVMYGEKSFGSVDVGPGSERTRQFTIDEDSYLDSAWKVYITTYDGHYMDINVMANQY